MKEVCKSCGTYRVLDYGATDPTNGRQATTVEFIEADEASESYSREQMEDE